MTRFLNCRLRRPPRREKQRKKPGNEAAIPIRRCFGRLSDGGLDLFAAFGQTFRQIAQTAAQQRRAQRQARREQQMQPKCCLRLRTAVRPAPNLNNLPPKAIERLQDMPPDRQEKFLQNNQRFQNLPPEQQARIRQRLQAWNRLTPSSSRICATRQRVWEQMTPEQQRDVRQTLLPRWQQLPPPRRQAIMQRLHSLRDLSEADRQAKLNDPDIRRRFERRGPRDAQPTRSPARRHGS